MNVRIVAVILTIAILTGSWMCGAQSTQPSTEALSPVLDGLRKEAAAVEPLVKSALAKQFLEAVNELPTITPRTIYRDETTRQCMTAAERERLGAEAQAKLKPIEIAEDRYYYTRYGTPVAYARAMDVAGEAGLESVAGAKVLDIGYGTIGHLRMMAARGAKVTGLDVDTFLTAVYSEPGDTGTIGSANGTTGTIALVNGRLSEEAVRTAVGDGYDLIISKNTLKRGYIHPPPEQNVDERMLVDLGVDDATFVKTMFEMLKPGGIMLIYNLSPKQANLEAGEKYIPWADGRCPFERELLEKAGFKVGEYDRNDDAAARAMGDALGWDDGENGMDLQNDLFAHYTVLTKPG